MPARGNRSDNFCPRWEITPVATRLGVNFSQHITYIRTATLAPARQTGFGSNRCLSEDLHRRLTRASIPKPLSGSAAWRSQSGGVGCLFALPTATEQRPFVASIRGGLDANGERSICRAPTNRPEALSVAQPCADIEYLGHPLSQTELRPYDCTTHLANLVDSSLGPKNAVAGKSLLINQHLLTFNKGQLRGS